MLTVASVHPPVAALMPGELSVSDVQQKVDASAANLASSAAVLLRDRGWQAEGVELEGDPKTKITEYAREMGRRSGGGRLLRSAGSGEILRG